jgi:DNA recombination protein RmuC
MTETIFVALLVLTAGIIITWLFLKSKFASRLAELQSRLDVEQRLQSELRDSNKSLQENIARLNESLSQTLQQKARYESQLSNAEALNSQVEEQKRQLIANEENLRKVMEGLKQENAIIKARNEESLVRLKEQHAFLYEANVKLKEAFDSLSAQALKNNNESFVTLAKSALATHVAEAKGELDKKQEAIDALVKPLSESLGKFDTKIQELEKVRMEQHGQINQYIHGIQQTTEKLQKETQSLVSALKTSHGRGRYGEIALRRVVEVAGMTEHCDFKEQVSVSSEDGILRPDMVISLPERKTIVVDSKVPLNAYMRAFETDNEDERRVFLGQHASAVRDHLKNLSNKAYWNQFPDSPDWVVLYMQIESSFGAALQADPTLVEDAIKNRVIFATPTTLITLLRTVGFVWQQVSIAENIEEIRDAGIELYNRTTVLMKHFANIGSSLKGAVTHYNSAVASLESRFLPQARKLHTLGSAYTSHTLPEADPVETSIRELVSSEELLGEEDVAKG